MAKSINPFIVTGKIAPKYFCDWVGRRRVEHKWNTRNRNNSR